MVESSSGPSPALGALRARRRGKLDYAELGERMEMHESRDKSNLYAGYATKAA